MDASIAPILDNPLQCQGLTRWRRPTSEGNDKYDKGVSKLEFGPSAAPTSRHKDMGLTSFVSAILFTHSSWSHLPFPVAIPLSKEEC